MRILMVYCNTSQDNTVPIGITQVITCLQKTGHEVSLFHTTFYRHGGKSSAELRMEALQYRPCEYTYEKSDMCSDFVKKIREERKFKVIADLISEIRNDEKKALQILERVLEL